MRSSRFKKSGIKLIAIFGLSTMVLAGCELDTTSGVLNSAPKATKIAFKDNCAALRKPFKDIRAQRDKVIGENVAAGVAAGAIAVLLAGGDSKQALAGALVGGLAGGAAAYAKNASSRGATEASLARFATADARKEAVQNDRLVRNIVQMNACRIDQADSALARATKKEITPGQARFLLNQIKIETRADNRSIQRIATYGKSYNAYVGVLDKKDVAAAQATRRSVAAYKPKVSRVKRTGRGKAAIAPQRVRSAATPIAQAENSRKLIRTAAIEHQSSVTAEVKKRESKLNDLIKRDLI
jgi:hypothetical protein